MTRGTSRLRRLGAWFLDKVLDNVAGFLIALALTGGLGFVGSVVRGFAHRRFIVSFAIGFAIGIVLSLIAATIRAVRDARKRAQYLESQKELIYNALESIQQAVAIEEDWALDQLVQRGVLEPLRGLLMKTAFEDVRLSVLVPVDDDAEEWTMRWAAGHRPEGVRNYRRPIDLTLAGKAFRTGATFVCQDVRSHPEFVPNPREQRPFRSLVAQPLRTKEDIVGVLSVVSTEPNAFDETLDVSFIQVVGSVIDVLLATELDAQAWQDYADEQRAAARLEEQTEAQAVEDQEPDNAG